jgi:hypothetical protein
VVQFVSLVALRSLMKCMALTLYKSSPYGYDDSKDDDDKDLK